MIITSKNTANRKKETVVYPVKDLIIPIPKLCQ